MPEPNYSEAQALEMLQSEWQHTLGTFVPPPEASVLALPAEMRLPLSPLALFAELEDVRDAWQQLFRDPRLTQFAERRINTRWSLRELLGHLSYWAAEFESELRTAAEDREFDYAIPGVMSEKGPTDWNEREVIKRRGATLDEIFAEYNRATEGLLELVLAMPEPRLLEPRGLPYSPSGDPAARWHGPAGMVPYFKCMHDRYHFEQIRKWLDAQE